MGGMDLKVDKKQARHTERSPDTIGTQSKGMAIPLVLLNCLAHPSTTLRYAQDDAGMGGMDLKVDKKQARHTEQVACFTPRVEVRRTIPSSSSVPAHEAAESLRLSELPSSSESNP